MTSYFAINSRKALRRDNQQKPLSLGEAVEKELSLSTLTQTKESQQENSWTTTSRKKSSCPSSNNFKNQT
jgi:hypothetical protein